MWVFESNWCLDGGKVIFEPVCRNFSLMWRTELLAEMLLALNIRLVLFLLRSGLFCCLWRKEEIYMVQLKTYDCIVFTNSNRYTNLYSFQNPSPAFIVEIWAAVIHDMIECDLECPWHDRCIICSYMTSHALISNILCTLLPSQKRDSEFSV